MIVVLGHILRQVRNASDHIAESLQWLFENLPLGGVQIEAGDNGVCLCKLCRDRRQYPTGRFSWEDYALLHPVAIEAVRDVKPDAWIFCETYSHPEPYTGEGHPGFGGGKTAWADECLAKIPDGVFIAWVYDLLGDPPPKRIWTKAGDINDKRHHHIMRAHFSTYWAGIRGELAIDAIATMTRESIEHGADVTSLFGEVSPLNTGAELNYLALENFGSSRNPSADVNVFLRDVAAPLLGGESHAHAYVTYAGLKDAPGRIPQALEDIYKRCGSLPPQAARRWAWLANFLASMVY